MKYGIQLPDETLAKIRSSYNGNDRYACGEYTYSLTDEEGYPDWLVDNIEDVHRVISEEVGWYNSEANQPTWGSFKQSDFTPVSVEIVTMPLNLIPIPNLEKEVSWVFDRNGKRLAEMTGRREDYLQYIGKMIMFGQWFNRNVVKDVFEDNGKCYLELHRESW